MKASTANTIIIVSACQYTSLGLATLFENLFYSKVVFYHRVSEIKDNSNELMTIAAIDDSDINYDDVIYLEKRMSKSSAKNFFILCDSMLINVLYSVFNISCLYLPRNIALKELHSKIVNALLAHSYEGGYNFKPQLTGLESQILIMLSEGFTVSEISRIKNKSSKTISSQKYNLMKKMGMPNTPKSVSVLSLYLKSICRSGNRAVTEGVATIDRLTFPSSSIHD